MKARLIAASVVAAAFTAGVLGMYAATIYGAHKMDKACERLSARQASAISGCVMSRTGR